MRAGEHERLRSLRLASLAADPASFAATHARDAAQPPEWWRRWAAQSGEGTRQRTFVLVDADDRWLGLALVRRDDDRPGCAVLHAMWVAPEARGRGAAGALCDACAAWAAERHLRELTLTVLVDNERARLAYERAGFVARGPASRSRRGPSLHELIAGRPPARRHDGGPRQLVMARRL